MFSVYLALTVFVMFLSKGIKIIMDYDAWLEKPYQDEREARNDYDSAAEAFFNTDTYWEHYEQWAMPLFKDGVHCSTEVWEGTADYEQSVGSFWASYTEPEPMPDDFPYRERW